MEGCGRQSCLNLLCPVKKKTTRVGVVATGDRKLLPQPKKRAIAWCVSVQRQRQRQGYRAEVCFVTKPASAAPRGVSCCAVPLRGWLSCSFFTDLPGSARLLGKDVDAGSARKSNGTRTPGSPVLAPDRTSRVPGPPYPTIPKAYLYLLTSRKGKC